MNRFLSKGAQALVAVVTIAAIHSLAQARSAEDLYRSFCASCHGLDMSGGLGPSLRDDQWKHGSSDEDISRIIKQGVPKAGMPAMDKMVTDSDIRALIILIRENAAKAQEPAPVAESAVIEAGGHKFKLEKVASAPGELWSMDFLDATTWVATQKDGKLWVFRNGERQGPVVGTPTVYTRSQGGLLEVQRHPEPQSRWIYLTYADPASGGAMTKVVRGKLDGLRWVEQQTIYAADSKFYTDRAHHFGSRLVLRDGYVYFSIGDRGAQEEAQDLSLPNGKIHRLHDDGRIPKDNPYVSENKALPSIWSYGHRNPQGLAVHPQTGDLWASEHGPRGGDEINRLIKGANFGWPVITYGMNYDGTPITADTSKEAMEQPKHYWVPSIAVSGIAFYSGDKFPSWRNQLLVGSLAKQQLRLLRIEGERVTGDQVLFEGLGRVRDIDSGPDGYPYVVLNGVQGGAIYRLVPAP